MPHAHDPLPESVRETIDLWASDSLERPAVAGLARAWGPEAGAMLVTFLEACCHGGTAPGDVGEHEVSHALLDHLADLDLPHRDALPGLLAAFVGDLEDQGRLAGGRSLGVFIRALAPRFRERASGAGPDLTRPAPKIGRNDPCPCGSGKKYKACCLARLS
jgi:hypothetical protein